MTRILIADDHDVVRSGLNAILSGQSGWEVVAEAEDGRKAVELVVETKPDVVILDYQLPSLNGVDATREIRAVRPQTEVLIFTMHESELLLREALEAGARGYLLKSDARKFLIAAVESLSQHKPFFTGRISLALLNAFLSQGHAADGALTARERGVVQLIAEGHSNKEVAQILGLNLKTVESHRASAMRKVNVNSTATLVRYAIRNKLVEP
ncbi:response regulator [Microvirga lotononidis]|uniref:Response regulator containing a CheY-like receiver domain and an HTH DNA-binding domain n=1 Tax=Microvirga lotononidis TaxID=864069 RepID=I4YKT6_9HYPH|nr:response regulator transcription factor [Microvirga lotononidis]EIM24578.1 response regulator containing a CheY-like receiver domain and an HTH DNA-binding domain [Microvirga lotononidis]WQO26597.1 response regulator transcription factor [Microvirga lotononidis]